MDKKKTVKLLSLSEALNAFIKHNCIPILPGGGEIGEVNPKAIDCEIRIKLHEDGTGYIHKLGEDSSTENFSICEKDELSIAIEHINALTNKYGLASDSLMWHHKLEALKFLLKYDVYYNRLKGKKKLDYAKDFLNP